MKNTLLLFGLLAFLTFKNQAQTVTDVDGNVYNTVTIGTQVWMKENLRTTKYNDGTAIPNSITWNYTSSGAYCDYDNTPSNSAIYGRLYNCLLYTSDAADDLTRVDLGGRRIIKKKK